MLSTFKVAFRYLLIGRFMVKKERKKKNRNRKKFLSAYFTEPN